MICKFVSSIASVCVLPEEVGKKIPVVGKARDVTIQKLILVKKKGAPAVNHYVPT